jgi:DNA-directed RNA polymerase specialized sigma24 family protein
LSCEEIARIVDCPLGTVKSRIHHGLAALRTATRKTEPSKNEPSDE